MQLTPVCEGLPAVAVDSAVAAVAVVAVVAVASASQVSGLTPLRKPSPLPSLPRCRGIP